MKLFISMAIAAVLLVGCEETISSNSDNTKNNIVNVSSSNNQVSSFVTSSSSVFQYSSVVQYSSISQQSSSSIAVVQNYPIDVTVNYEAASEQTLGQYFISYTINNYSLIPVKILSAQYAIYGSQGGMLNDIVVTRDNLEYIWIPAQTYQTNWFEGYSANYVPYSFQFLINFVDSSGKTKAVTFSGVVKVFVKRKIHGVIEVLPPAYLDSKITQLK